MLFTTKTGGMAQNKHLRPMCILEPLLQLKASFLIKNSQYPINILEICAFYQKGRMHCKNKSYILVFFPSIAGKNALFL